MGTAVQGFSQSLAMVALGGYCPRGAVSPDPLISAEGAVPRLGPVVHQPLISTAASSPLGVCTSTFPPRFLRARGALRPPAVPQDHGGPPCPPLASSRIVFWVCSRRSCDSSQLWSSPLPLWIRVHLRSCFVLIF